MSTSPVEDIYDTSSVVVADVDVGLGKRCPFFATSNRTILDFTKQGTYPLNELVVRADLDVEDAMLELSQIHIKPGIYKIHLASYHDATKTTTLLNPLGERWYLELFDSDNNQILKTQPTRDIQNDEVYIEETVESAAAVGTDGYFAVGKHDSYPDSNPYIFSPLCAALDFVEEISKKESITGDHDTKILNSNEAQNIEPTVTANFENELTNVHTFMGCPISPKEGRIIVDFTKNKQRSIQELKIASNKKNGTAKTDMYSTLVPRGVYTVRLASFGYKLDDLSQDHQEWYVALLDGSSSVISETPSSDDVPDWATEDYTRKVSENFVVGKDVVAIIGSHSKYPTSEPNSVSPLCASFDLVRTLPEEETDSSRETLLTKPSTSEEPVRDIFDVYTDEDASIFETKTTVVVPREKAKEDLLQTTKTQVLTNTSDTQKEDSEKRNEIVSILGNNPFEALLNLSQKERELAMRNNFSEKTSINLVEDKSFAEQKIVSLSRKSFENMTSLAQKEKNTDVGRSLESFRFKEREKLANMVDSDEDGVIDYDEKYIYKTNPLDSFTAGSALTDGERILLGLNPQNNSDTVNIVESPKKSGDEQVDLFTIKEIVLTRETVTDSTTAPKESIQIKGTTEPLAFITLYIYSTPIITTIRSDKDGNFEYLLDEKLEDGLHEIYVASVNTAGSILAKSESIPFLKTAEAIEYAPMISRTETGPANDAMKRAITLTLLVVLVGTFGVINWFGYFKSQFKKSKVELRDIFKHTI